MRGSGATALNGSMLMLVMLKTCSILVLSLLFCSALAAAEDYPIGDKPFRRYIAEAEMVSASPSMFQLRKHLVILSR